MFNCIHSSLSCLFPRQLLYRYSFLDNKKIYTCVIILLKVYCNFCNEFYLIIQIFLLAFFCMCDCVCDNMSIVINIELK